MKKKIGCELVIRDKGGVINLYIADGRVRIIYYKRKVDVLFPLSDFRVPVKHAYGGEKAPCP